MGMDTTIMVLVCVGFVLNLLLFVFALYRGEYFMVAWGLTGVVASVFCVGMSWWH